VFILRQRKGKSGLHIWESACIFCALTGEDLQAARAIGRPSLTVALLLPNRYAVEWMSKANTDRTTSPVATLETSRWSATRVMPGRILLPFGGTKTFAAGTFEAVIPKCTGPLRLNNLRQAEVDRFPLAPKSSHAGWLSVSTIIGSFFILPL